MPRNSQLVNFNASCFAATSVSLCQSLLRSSLPGMCSELLASQHTAGKDSVRQSPLSEANCQWSSTVYWIGIICSSIKRLWNLILYHALCWVLRPQKGIENGSYPSGAHRLTWNLTTGGTGNNNSGSILSAHYVLSLLFLLTHLSLTTSS